MYRTFPIAVPAVIARYSVTHNDHTFVFLQILRDPDGLFLKYNLSCAPGASLPLNALKNEIVEKGKGHREQMHRELQILNHIKENTALYTRGVSMDTFGRRVWSEPWSQGAVRPLCAPLSCPKLSAGHDPHP